MQVAKVDRDRVLDTLLERRISLNLTEDVASHGGMISVEMQEKALKILQQLKEEAEKASGGKLQMAGIATAVFRKAANGTDVLKLFDQRLGIHLAVLSQEEEGRLGYMTAKALYPEIPEDRLIVWDNGNGSFQITSQQGIYQGPLGYGTVRVLLSQEIRNGPIFLPHESGNPVSWEEAALLADKIRLHLPEKPQWLATMLSEKAIVVTFGDGKSLFPVVAESLAIVNGKSGYAAAISQADLQKMRDLFLEQDDDLFDAMGIYNRMSSASVFLLAMMEYLGIDAIQFKKATGNTSGILISPRFFSFGT